MTLSAEEARVRRNRRNLWIGFTILVLLLLVALYFLLTLMRPVGRVASTPEAAGGLTWVRSIYGWGSDPLEQLNQPNDVAIGPDGTIWVTDQARARIVGFSPDGELRTTLSAGEPNSGPDALSFPSGVAVGDDGLIYVADSVGGKVVVFDDQNNVIRRYVVPNPLDVAARGDIVVIGATDGFIIVTKEEGEVVKLVGTRGKGEDQFDSARGIEIAEDGTIFVVDQYNNRLSAYDSQGNRKWILKTGRSGNQTPVGTKTEDTSTPIAMALPAHLTIDGAGRLVIADPFDFSLTVLDAADGSLIAKYGRDGTEDGRFTYPTGVSYDAERDWFAVADTANGRVQIVRLPGSGGSAISGLRRSFAGPLRALIFPLILVIIWLTYTVLARILRRRRQRLTPVQTESNLNPEV